MSKWKKDFPILSIEVHGHPLIYLDNAATTQMPQAVMNRLEKHWKEEHANIHRGNYYLSELSTQSVEEARNTVAGFIGAEKPEEVIFTRGTTDGVNMVAESFREKLGIDNGILVTELEHHSNYVPWQQVCKKSGAAFHVCKAPDGRLDISEMEKILSENNIVLVAVTHTSNLTGTVNPIRKVIELAHRFGAQVLIDGAQGIRHLEDKVSGLDCDYYCFSGHKLFAPTGTGVLYGKMERLEELTPARFGGGMVDIVKKEETTWGDIPHCFEPGTADISGIIGLKAAIDYLNENDRTAMLEHERALMSRLEDNLKKIDGLNILAHPDHRAGALSFADPKAHPYDIAAFLDKYGIAVRAGNHCAQPALCALGFASATRVSPAFYNTVDEIDEFSEALKQVLEKLRKYN